MFKATDIEKVPTASVVAILKTHEIQKEFLNSNSVARMLRLAREQEVVLFDSAENEILNFNHEIFAGGENAGIGKNAVIRLSIVDPLFKFEDQFLSIGFKSLYGTNSKVLEEIARLRRLRQPKETKDVVDARNILTSIQHEIDVLYNQTNLPDTKKKIDSLYSKKERANKKLAELIEAEEERFFAVVRKNISDLEGGLQPSVLFFYGIGEDVESWAGPVEGTLKSINYNYNGDGGVRVLNLEYFSINPILGPSQEKAFYTGLGRNISVATPIGPGVTPTDNFDTYKLGEKPGDLTYPTHDIVKDLCSKFLSRVVDLPSDNVLVLFPNLNVLTREKQSQLFLACFNSLVDSAGGVESAVSKITFIGTGLGNILQPGVALYESIKAALRDETNADLALRRNFNKLANVLSFHKMYEEMGFTVGLDDNLDTELEVVGAGNVQGNIERYSTSATPTNNKFIVSLSKNEITSVHETISKLANGINSVCSKNLGFIELFFENDPLIKKIYKKALPEGNNFNEDLPILFFGDTNFILNYFYGFIGAGVLDSTTTNPTDLVAPGDKGLLLNSTRLQSMADLLGLVERTSAPYDALFYSLPDEYTFVDKDELGYAKQTKSKVKAEFYKEQIPIFIHGFENSNILEMNVDWDLQYTTTIMEGFKPTLNDTVMPGSVQGKSLDKAFGKLRAVAKKSMSEENIDSLLSNIRNVLSNSNGGKKDTRIITNIFKQYFPSLDENYLQGISEQMVTALVQSKSVGNFTIDEFMANAIPNKMIEILRRISSFALVANIKTLPFFRFYNMVSVLHFKCFLFMREAAILGQEDRTQKMSSLLSGEWSIVGFRHTISENEISSNFILIRIPGSSPSPHTLLRREEE